MDDVRRDEVEVRGAASGEEKPVTRSGEPPRQQIRKAKQTGRRTFTTEDKIRIVMEGIRGEDPVSELCRRERLHNTVYYRWLKDFMEGGKQRVQGKRLVWNALRPQEREVVRYWALNKPGLSCRELALWLCDRANFSVSESTVRRLLKAWDLLPRRAPEQEPAAKEWHHRTTRINELWQSDASRFFIPGWGHYWLVSVLDDYSRRLLAWELAADVQTTSLAEVIQLAVERTGVISAPPVQRPALLTDNGSG